MALTGLVDAVATDPDEEPPFTSEDRIYPARAIVGYCSSFLRITATNEKWLSSYDSDKGLFVQLAHFSVQEYLLLDRRENPYHESFDRQSANATITQIYLAYLWTAGEAEETEHSILESPFADYAVGNWLDHASIAGESEESTFKWIYKSFTNDRFIGHWWRPQDDGEVDRLSPTPALFNASSYGLDRSVEHLLEAGADANGYTVGFGTALQGACGSGGIRSL